MALSIRCGDKALNLSQTVVMGILNVTPDSFSDGGIHNDYDAAVARAFQLEEEGADILDIGGESSRPGAMAIGSRKESERVIPLLKYLAKHLEIPISIDTYHPQTMRMAIDAGASMINDIRALQEENALEIVKNSGLAVCLMHMQGMPDNMQNNPIYDRVTFSVSQFLQSRIDACLQSGMASNQLIIDPGFGFGKSVQHNIELLRNLSIFREITPNILVGLSRKSIIGQSLNLAINDRLEAGLALALIALKNGARIIRTHDVRESVKAIRMWETIYPEALS